MEASEAAASPRAEMAEMPEENGGPAVAPDVSVRPDPVSFSMPPPAEDDEGELPADFERLWKAAHDNPQDFTGWTDLLQYCEQEVCSRRCVLRGEDDQKVFFSPSVQIRLRY